MIKSLSLVPEDETLLPRETPVESVKEKTAEEKKKALTDKERENEEKKSIHEGKTELAKTGGNIRGINLESDVNERTMNACERDKQKIIIHWEGEKGPYCAERTMTAQGSGNVNMQDNLEEGKRTKPQEWKIKSVEKKADYKELLEGEEGKDSLTKDRKFTEKKINYEDLLDCTEKKKEVLRREKELLKMKETSYLTKKKVSCENLLRIAKGKKEGEAPEEKDWSFKKKEIKHENPPGNAEEKEGKEFPKVKKGVLKHKEVEHGNAVDDAREKREEELLKELQSKEKVGDMKPGGTGEMGKPKKLREQGKKDNSAIAGRKRMETKRDVQCGNIVGENESPCSDGLKKDVNEESSEVLMIKKGTGKKVKGRIPLNIPGGISSAKEEKYEQRDKMESGPEEVKPASAEKEVTERGARKAGTGKESLPSAKRNTEKKVPESIKKQQAAEEEMNLVSAKKVLPGSKDVTKKQEACPVGIADMAHDVFTKTSKFPKKQWNLLSQFKRKTLKIEENQMVGEFFNYEDRSIWRLIGMRSVRTNVISIEYDVLRLYKAKIGTDSAPFKEMTVTADNNHILKLCNSDSTKDHVLFMQQYKLLEMMSRRYQSHRQRRHFPNVFGCGAFDELLYREEDIDVRKQLLFYYPYPNPRPYFLQEKVEPSVEGFFRMTPFNVLNIGVARDIIIGCVKALRCVHLLGYVHRCVTPYNFAIRNGFSNFPSHKDMSDRICLMDFSLCRRFKGTNAPSPRRVAPFVGTYKYCSVSAHNLNEQFPADDLTSCLYMFCEFVHGVLPWKGITSVKTIKRMKKELEEKPPIFMDNTGENRVLIDLRELPGIFKLIQESDPYSRLPYRMIYKMLNAISARHEEVDESPSALVPLNLTKNERRGNRPN